VPSNLPNLLCHLHPTPQIRTRTRSPRTKSDCATKRRRLRTTTWPDHPTEGQVYMSLLTCGTVALSTAEKETLLMVAALLSMNHLLLPISPRQRIMASLILSRKSAVVRLDTVKNGIQSRLANMFIETVRLIGKIHRPRHHQPRKNPNRMSSAKLRRLSLPSTTAGTRPRPSFQLLPKPQETHDGQETHSRTKRRFGPNQRT
jgi:hypothetical protein